jgi:ABC-type phosphate transport system substrate-binding protein
MYSNLTTLEITEDIPFNDGNPATRKWSELNNACVDKEIIIVGPPNEAGTNAYFREVMFTSTSPRESFRAGYTTFTDNSPQLRDYILNTDASIGYLGFFFYNQNHLDVISTVIF